MEQQKPVLVTGGAGFVGRHLCKRLLADGHSVICLDNMQTGSFFNIEEFKEDSRFSFVEADVTEAYEFDVKQIYNLACPASPPHYQKDPVKTLKTCFLGAVHALELATELGCKLLQASTSEVYGDPTVHPQPENYHGNVNPIGPRACYDEGKRVAETLFFDFRRAHGTKIKVVRIFNTYGPYMDPNDGRVVSNFIVQALKGDNITVYGDGSQTRSFCYIDDLVDGLVRMMASNDDVVGPINLGNPKEFTIEELSSIIVKKLESKSRIDRRPLPLDDPKLRRPVIDEATSQLNWRPQTELSDGIDRTIRYFQVVLGGANAAAVDSSA